MAKVNRKILIISKCMQYFHLMRVFVTFGAGLE